MCEYWKYKSLSLSLSIHGNVIREGGIIFKMMLQLFKIFPLVLSDLMYILQN